jgi:hypothetical protein
MRYHRVVPIDAAMPSSCDSCSSPIAAGEQCGLRILSTDADGVLIDADISGVKTVMLKMTSEELVLCSTCVDASWRAVFRIARDSHSLDEFCAVNDLIALDPNSV